MQQVKPSRSGCSKLSQPQRYVFHCKQQFTAHFRARFVSFSNPCHLHLAVHAGPDALVGRIPGETKHSARLLDLCTECHANEEVLVCRIPAADIVLVPRLPSIAERDNIYFVAYATNIQAVKLCETLRSKRQVAVVLDIDNTLIDATPASISEEDWQIYDWIDTPVESASGRKIAGKIAHIPGSDMSDSTQERAFYIHWKVGRMTCTFKVRVRIGWSAFREFLLTNSSRFAPFVCSKGKLEYVQLIWEGLDQGPTLIPRELWHSRITSTYPDTLARAGQKTALVALGCADVTRPAPPTQMAAPMMCLDDSPEAYDPEYSDSILYVEEYRPSDGVHSDRGSVLGQVCARLEAYWAATCTEAGTFAWQAAQSFATAILGAMQKTPIESPDALAYLQGRCNKQGTALWHQVTVSNVFDNDVYVADAELAGSGMQVDGEVYIKIGSPTKSASHGNEMMHPLLREAAMVPLTLSRQSSGMSLAHPPARENSYGRGNSGQGERSSMELPSKARNADDVLTAELMMKC